MSPLKVVKCGQRRAAPRAEAAAPPSPRAGEQGLDQIRAYLSRHSDGALPPLAVLAAEGAGLSSALALAADWFVRSQPLFAARRGAPRGRPRVRAQTRAWGEGGQGASRANRGRWAQGASLGQRKVAYQSWLAHISHFPLTRCRSGLPENAVVAYRQIGLTADSLNGPLTVNVLAKQVPPPPPPSLPY